MKFRVFYDIIIDTTLQLALRCATSVSYDKLLALAYKNKKDESLAIMLLNEMYRLRVRCDIVTYVSDDK